MAQRPNIPDARLVLDVMLRAGFIRQVAAGIYTYLPLGWRVGCYGIGVSRLLSAIVEQNHDPNGIIWPISVAPFHVNLIHVSIKDQAQIDIADQLYHRLRNASVDVLLDDRDERPGVKFKDSDLIGIPIRITIGKRAGEGFVEFKERGSMEQNAMSVEAALSMSLELVKKIIV